MEDQIGGTWTEEKIYEFTDVVQKAEGKRTVDKPRCRCEK
jgi:hypothetical protein